MQPSRNPYAMVVGRKNGEKFLRVISHADFIAMHLEHNFRLDGVPVAVVSPESRALQNAWTQAETVQPPYHYRAGRFFVDTNILANGKWETMLVCADLNDTFYHAHEIEAKVVCLTTINAHKSGIAHDRIAQFIPLLVEAFRSMEEQLKGLFLRNQVLTEVSSASIEIGMKLMMDNTFQAGLNVLDPDFPLFITDPAVQQVVFKGLMSIIDQYRMEDALSDMEDEGEELFEDIDEGPLATMAPNPDYIESRDTTQPSDYPSYATGIVYPKTKRVPVRRTK